MAGTVELLNVKLQNVWNRKWDPESPVRYWYLTYNTERRKKPNSSCSPHGGHPPSFSARWERQRIHILKTQKRRVVGSSNLVKRKKRLALLSYYRTLYISQIWRALLLHLQHASCPGVLKQVPKQTPLLQTYWSCSKMWCPLLLKTAELQACTSHAGIISFHGDSVKSTFTLRVFLFFMLRST